MSSVHPFYHCRGVPSWAGYDVVESTTGARLYSMRGDRAGVYMTSARIDMISGRRKVSEESQGLQGHNACIDAVVVCLSSL